MAKPKGRRFLIVEGSNRYINVETEEKLHRAALSLLKKYFTSDFEKPEPVSPETKEIANISDATILALPTGRLRQEIQNRRQNAIMELHQSQSALKEYGLALRAIGDKDGALAWKILTDRDSDCDIEVRYLEEP